MFTWTKPLNHLSFIVTNVNLGVLKLSDLVADVQGRIGGRGVLLHTPLTVLHTCNELLASKSEGVSCLCLQLVSHPLPSCFTYYLGHLPGPAPLIKALVVGLIYLCSLEMVHTKYSSKCTLAH